MCRYRKEIKENNFERKLYENVLQFTNVHHKLCSCLIIQNKQTTKVRIYNTNKKQKQTKKRSVRKYDNRRETEINQETRVNHQNEIF